MRIMRVYFDNAASTPMDAEVFEKMLPFLKEQHGNPSSVHYHGRNLRNAVEQARKQIATELNCSVSEIIFTSGGTEADNYAIKSSVEGLGIEHIISSPIEHHAVTHTVELVSHKHNIPVSWLKPNEKGQFSLEELEDLLKKNPKSLVSLMHANNEIGTIADIEAVGKLCRQYGAIFHSDTVQTVGTLPIDLQQIPVDFITGAAHKFYGPKGIGFLFRREGLNVPSLICGGTQERNQRAGTENVAGIVGMAAALEKCIKIRNEKITHLQNLKDSFISRVQNLVPGTTINGISEKGGSLPSVANIAFPGKDLESMLLMNLDIHQISASGGSACTSGANSVSHVLSGIGCAPVRCANSVRFSFGMQNTMEEVDYVVNTLVKLVK